MSQLYFCSAGFRSVQICGASLVPWVDGFLKLLVLLSKISQQENPGTQWWLEDYSFPFGMCFFRGYARFRNLSLGTAWICILVHSLIFFSIKPTQKYVQSKSNLICISFQFYTLYRNFVVCVPSIFRAIYSKYTLLYFI